MCTHTPALETNVRSLHYYPNRAEGAVPAFWAAFQLRMLHGKVQVFCALPETEVKNSFPFVFLAPWYSPQSRSCRNSAGLLELCVLYRVEHSRPRTQSRPSMQNTALWRTCEPAARKTFQFPSSIYSRCVPNILGSQPLLLILSGMSIILAKSTGP